MPTEEEMKELRDRTVVTLETIERLLLSIQKSTSRAYGKDYHTERGSAVSQIDRLITECREKIERAKSGPPEILTHAPPNEESQETASIILVFKELVHKLGSVISDTRSHWNGLVKRPANLTVLLTAAQSSPAVTQQQEQVIQKMMELLKTVHDQTQQAIQIKNMTGFPGVDNYRKREFHETVEMLLNEIKSLIEMVS